jgi:hypothetical protein
VEVLDELCPPPCVDVLEIEGFFGRWFPRWMRSTAAVPLKYPILNHVINFLFVGKLTF